MDQDEKTKFNLPRTNAARELLRSLLAEAEADVASLKRAIAELDRNASQGMRFAKCDGQMDAAIKLLYEDGGPQTVVVLANALVAGGACIGNARPQGEARKGIGSGVKNGFLKQSRPGPLTKKDADDILVELTEKGRKEYHERKLNEM